MDKLILRSWIEINNLLFHAPVHLNLKILHFYWYLKFLKQTEGKSIPHYPNFKYLYGHYIHIQTSAIWGMRGEHFIFLTLIMNQHNHDSLMTAVAYYTIVILGTDHWRTLLHYRSQPTSVFNSLIVITVSDLLSVSYFDMSHWWYSNQSIVPYLKLQVPWQASPF
jgi:hypothetical protein